MDLANVLKQIKPVDSFSETKSKAQYELAYPIARSALSELLLEPYHLCVDQSCDFADFLPADKELADLLNDAYSKRTRESSSDRSSNNRLCIAEQIVRELKPNVQRYSEIESYLCDGLKKS